MGFRATAGDVSVLKGRFDHAVGWAELQARKHGVVAVVEAGEQIDDMFVPYSDGVIVHVFPNAEAEAAA